MTLKTQDDRGEVAYIFGPGAHAKPRHGNANLKTILGILFKKASTHECVALPSLSIFLYLYLFMYLPILQSIYLSIFPIMGNFFL